MKTMIAAYVSVLAGRGAPTFDLRRQEGQAMAEYAFILGLMALAVVVAMIFMRDKIASFFTEVGNQF